MGASQNPPILLSLSPGRVGVGGGNSWSRQCPLADEETAASCLLSSVPEWGCLPLWPSEAA